MQLNKTVHSARSEIPIEKEILKLARFFKEFLDSRLNTFLINIDRNVDYKMDISQTDFNFKYVSCDIKCFEGYTLCISFTGNLS